MKKGFYLFLFVLVISSATVFAQPSYYTETFSTLDKCDVALTDAFWNTDDSRGEPGRQLVELGYIGSGYGKPVDVCTNGKYIFASSVGANGGLYIFNPESYSFINSYVTGENEQGVAIDGKYAYIVDASGELERVDCGNLSSLSATQRNITGTPNIRAVASAGGYIYMATSGGLITHDWSANSDNTIATTDARDVCLFGQYLLLADGTGGLKIYSLANPASPSSIGSILSGEDCQGVSVMGTHAIVSATNKIIVVNILNPSSPSEVARSVVDGVCISACENAGLIFAACASRGTRVFDANNLPTLISLGNTQNHTGGKATSVVAIGHKVAIADSCGGGIQFLAAGGIFDPDEDWSATITTADIEDEAGVLDVVVLGDYAYMTVQTVGLVTVNLKTGSTYTNPVGSGNAALGLCSAGNTILVASGTAGLRCYSLSNPAQPSLLWTQALTNGQAWAVDAQGNYAYVSSGGGTVFGVYKIPILGASHAPVASYTCSHPIYSVDVSGNHVYIAADVVGLISLDLSLTPLDTLTFASGRCWGVIAENDYAYVSNFTGGISIARISNPSNMSVVASLSGPDIGSVLSIGRFDKYLLIGRDETNALVFVDVSNPTSPSIDGSIDVPTDADGLVIPAGFRKYKDKLLMGDYINGLRSWVIYPKGEVGNLIPLSYLYSTPVNTFGGIQYINWKADVDHEGDGTDIVSYYLKFSDGTTEDSIKIINNGEDPPAGPWGESWFDISENEWDDVWWYAKIQANTDPGRPGPVWFTDWVKVGYSASRPARRRVSGVVHVDFGTEIVDLIIGIDSFASDRFDPSVDISYYPIGPGPHAYWAIGDPSRPDIVGLSSCFMGNRAGAKPIRLVITEPARITWTFPPDLEPGTFVINGVDLATSTEMELPAGEHKLVPLANIPLYYTSRSVRGWNMVAPVASPLCETPSQIFGVSNPFIWTYDESMGGYYNTTEVGEGIGYFVLANENIMQTYQGVRVDWTRTRIHRGWNMIAGPTNGDVHVSSFITEPAGIIWHGPLYTLGDGGYIATEWLTPGKAYWAFGLGDGYLYADIATGTRKSIPLDDPDMSATLILSSAGNSTSLSLGIDPRAKVGLDSRFDRLLVPPLPTKRNIGYLLSDGSSMKLSRDVEPTCVEWTLHVLENCVATSDKHIIANDGNGEMEINSFGVSLAPGIYKLRFDSAPKPDRFIISASPNPFNSATLIKTYIPRAGKMELSVYDISGREVSRLFDGDASAGGRVFLWEGNDIFGRELPSGIYFVKLSLDGGIGKTEKIVMLK